jgi:hypothetical protein
MTKKRFMDSVLAVLILIGVITVASPGPAMADSSALLRCNGQLARHSVSGIPVPGNSTALGVELQYGEVYRIVPTWSRENAVNYGGWWIFNAGTWGPAGKLDDPAPNDGWWSVPGKPKYSLVGQTLANGGADRFYIGEDSGCRTYLGPPSTPRTSYVNLWLGVNDDNPWDNTGSYTATILSY